MSPNRLPCSWGITPPTQGPNPVHTPWLATSFQSMAQEWCSVSFPRECSPASFYQGKCLWQAGQDWCHPAYVVLEQHIQCPRPPAQAAQMDVAVKSQFFLCVLPYKKKSPGKWLLHCLSNNTYLISFLNVTNFLQRWRVVGGELLSTCGLVPLIVNKYLKREQGEWDGQEKEKQLI